MSCGRPLTRRLSDRRDLITATATDVSCLHEVLTRRINPGSWAFVPGVTGAPDTFLLFAPRGVGHLSLSRYQEWSCRKRRKRSF